MHYSLPNDIALSCVAKHCILVFRTIRVLFVAWVNKNRFGFKVCNCAVATLSMLRDGTGTHFEVKTVVSASTSCCRKAIATSPYTPNYTPVGPPCQASILPLDNNVYP